LPSGRRFSTLLKNSIDIHAYDEAKFGSQETILFEQAVREIGEGFAEVQ
jgi:hypothetical protein